ncbi:uncharacterized protein LOC131956458, partial [Physella acuta]|uniref:uncharacterized protein LOC131956458 n=1 Tax=Physella acuta TaxID=109671 RepID=UPI0027DB9712
PPLQQPHQQQLQLKPQLPHQQQPLHPPPQQPHRQQLQPKPQQPHQQQPLHPQLQQPHQQPQLLRQQQQRLQPQLQHPPLPQPRLQPQQLKLQQQHQTTTTTTPTTTTTTTTTTTPITTPPPSLCQVSARILNGARVVDQCAFAGIANITANNGNNIVCNAIFTRATVNGTYKSTFLTSATCKKVIEAGSKAGVVFSLQLGTQIVPILAGLINMYDGPNDVAFLDISDFYKNLVTGQSSCVARGACPYTPAIAPKVSLSDCKIVSYGANNASSTLRSDSLYETSVAFNFIGCSTVAKSSATVTDYCFRTISGQNLFCNGDAGAPVFCRAPSNNEWILFGVTTLGPSCNTSPEFRVLPYPG